jgi:predicted O-methyltransferase YrrM
VREFTVDWFDYHRGHLSRALAPFRGQPGLRMLEIGAYEGRSTVWFLEDLLTGAGSHLTSVDTWEGSAENDPNEMNAVWERFRHNTDAFVADGRLTVVVSRSQPFLAGQVARGETAPGQGYHIIYVDGSHAAPDVLSDAVLSWALLEPGGVMVFDDYVWVGMTTEQERPRFAIDSFLACFLGQYDELHRGIQVVIRRHGPAGAGGSAALPAAKTIAAPAREEAATPPPAPERPELSRRRRGQRVRT